MDIFFSPWRLDYILSEKDPEAPCVFCEAMSGAISGDESLVVYGDPLTCVILNRFPYNNGHLLIVPRKHVDTLTGLDPPVLHRCSELLAFSEYALRRAYNPQGINGGLNLGEAAGAGIAEHVHWHILPRWVGDTSSVTVLGNSRYVPEDLRTTKKKLKPIFEGFTPSK